MRTSLILALSLFAGVALAQNSPQLSLKDNLDKSVAVQETSEADQTDIAVTVYNNNRALVRDRRKVSLLPGKQSLKFMDVAAAIQPETVSLQSLSAPGKLAILEQNYEYDLMSPEKLMEKYVGKEVKLFNKHNDLSFFEQSAKLLSVNNGPVYEIEGSIYLGHPGTVVLPELPEALIAKPSLIWLLDNEETDHEVEATYLTNGLQWRADYVLSYDESAAKMNLEGWVTLNNQSGATYRQAQLKLVAGEVNMVTPDRRNYGRAGGAMKMMAMEAAPMEEESFAEYHLYTLPRRTTIKEKQNKQVRLLTATDVGIDKVYEYRGNAHYYASKQPRFEAEKVSAYLDFYNKEANQLGMPLPGGIMRVYQKDSDGMLQFSGEDKIEHTPKNEKVRLTLGKAFDVVAERKQTDYKNVMLNVHEAGFEITLRNHKAQAIVVDVVEPMPGDWQVLKESMPHEKKDAFSAVYHVPVPADGEATLSYRIRVKY